MRNLIFTALLAAILGLLSGVALADPGVIAGNGVEDRAYGPDSWEDFYLMDRNNGFSEDSFMTGFSVYVGRTSPFEFMVYADNDGGWEVVYRSGEITPVGLDICTEIIDPVYIPAGSYVGLYYRTNGAVPYSNGPEPFVDDLSKIVLFTDQGGTEVDFLHSDDRVYSIAAIGYSVSEYEARVSGGGQILAESTDESDISSKKKSDDNFKISFGVGAYIIDGQYFLKSCEVTFHNVSNNDIDKYKFVGEEVGSIIPTYGSLPMNFAGDGSVASFGVSGYLENDEGYIVDEGCYMYIRVQDSGEPGWEDNLRFELYDGDGEVYDSLDDFPRNSDYHGSARTWLDHGNLQVEDLR